MMDYKTWNCLCFIGALLFLINLNMVETKLTTITVAPGLTAILTCKSRQKAVWVDPRGITISVGNITITTDTRISVTLFYNNEWRLRIERVKDADAGVYRCDIPDDQVSYEVQLKVEAEKLETSTETKTSTGINVPNDCYQMCVSFHLISMMTFCYTLLGLFTR